MKEILHEARKLGPYLAAALLLPGGTVIVPLLWLLRNYPSHGATRNSPGRRIETE